MTTYQIWPPCHKIQYTAGYSNPLYRQYKCFIDSHDICRI